MAALGSAANTIETGESDVVYTSAYAGAAMQVELGDQLLKIFHGDEWHAAVVVGQGRNRIQMEATANGRFESFDVPQDRAAYFLRAPQLPAASRPRESYLEGRGAFAPDGSIRPDLSADLHEILRLQSQLACHNAHYMKVIRDLMWQKELAMFLYRQNNVFSGGTLPETDTLAILLRINYGLSAAEADELVIHLPQEVGTTFVTSSTEPQRTSRLLRFMRNGDQELFAHANALHENVFGEAHQDGADFPEHEVYGYAGGDATGILDLAHSEAWNRCDNTTLSVLVTWAYLRPVAEANHDEACIHPHVHQRLTTLNEDKKSALLSLLVHLCNHGCCHPDLQFLRAECQRRFELSQTRGAGCGYGY